MWRSVAIIVLTASVPALEGSTDIMKFLNQVLRDEMNQGDLLGFLCTENKPTYERHLLQTTVTHLPSTFLRNVMTASRGSVKTYSRLPILLPSQQLRNADFHIFFIWLHSSDEKAFEIVLKGLKTHRVFGPESKMILVVENIKEDDIVLNTFKLVWENLRLFYSLIIAFSRDCVDLYTFDPFHEKIKIHKVKGWSDSSIYRKSFLPSLPKTFPFYSLVVGYHPRPPFVMLPQSPGDPPEGSEMKIIYTIAASLSIRLAYKTTPSNEDPLITIFNDSYVGLFRMLFDNEVDIVSAGVTSFTAREIATCPLPQYSLDETVFLVPRSRIINHGKSLYGAFTPVVWLAMLITMFLFSFVLCAFSKNVNAALCYDAVLTVIIVNFEKSLTKYAMKRFTKPILCILFFYSILTTSYYKSSFTTLLTTPHYPKSIQTIEEAYDKGLVFYFIPVALQAIADQPNQKLWSRILRPGHYEANMNVTRHAYKTAIEQTGIAITNKHMYSYNYNHLFGNLGGESLVYELPERLFPFPLYIFFAPSHPLYPLFHIRQFHLVEAGLAEYWLKCINDNLRLRRRDIDGDRVSAMSFEKLSAVFYGTAGLFTLNVLVFCCEVLYFYFWRYSLL